MNTLIKPLTLLLFVISIVGCNTNDSDIKTEQDSQAINDVAFADANFEACVIEQAAENNWTTTNEVVELICQDKGIADAKGIEEFSNLKKLDLFRTSRILFEHALTGFQITVL